MEFHINPDRRHELIHWCLSRQVGGFQGRVNKDPDVCYSFWIGGSLQMIGCLDFVDQKQVKDFLLKCQANSGGFSKYPDMYPDVLHSYYSICWLSIVAEEGFESLDCTLGVSNRALSSYPARI